MSRGHYLLVVSEREALAWILAGSRMAFPAAPRRREVARLREHDHLFLLTTRGCFHNPTRDRTRVVGRATALGPAKPLPEPYCLYDREYPLGCDLEIHALAPYLQGVELGPLVPKLDAFHGAGDAWSFRLRRPLVELSDGDAELLSKELEPTVLPFAEAAPAYLARIKPVQTPAPAKPSGPAGAS